LVAQNLRSYRVGDFVGARVPPGDLVGFVVKVASSCGSPGSPGDWGMVAGLSPGIRAPTVWGGFWVAQDLRSYRVGGGLWEPGFPGRLEHGGGFVARNPGSYGLGGYLVARVLGFYRVGGLV